MMWIDGGWGGGWGGWLLMALVMVVFWGLVIAGIVALVHFLSGNRTAASGGPGRGSGRAEELLAERLARGEIDEEEYRKRRAVLRERD